MDNVPAECPCGCGAELPGTGRWLDTSQQAPLDTVRMILGHGAAGRL